MEMITRAKFISTDNIEIELTITMSAGEWRQISEQLITRWPSGKLSEHIRGAVSKLDMQVRVSNEGTVI